MQTSKPISTISYNSPEFLEGILKKLLDDGTICFYCFIKHLGEYDESIDYQEKDHIHLYVEPNKLLDTMHLGMMFKELDPENIKPLGTITWVSSKDFSEWLLYNLHDKDYLTSKFETRQYAYQLCEFVCSDYDDLDRRHQVARHSSGYARNKNLAEYISKGGSIRDVVKAGSIPPSQASGYYYFAKLIVGD